MRIEASLNELSKVAREILNLTNSNSIVLLKGDLASGKTTLVSQIVSEAGFSDSVSSPTFSLEHIYANRIFHYDLYRIDFEELASLGLLEEFEKDGLHLVEWADERLINTLLISGFEVYQVEITPSSKGRVYEIQKLHS